MKSYVKEDYENELSILGQRIFRLRKKVKLNLESITEIHPIYFLDIEKGFCNPTYITLLKIAKSLDCPIVELFED